MARAQEHGVECLVRRKLRTDGRWESMAAHQRELLDARAREESALEVLRRTALKRTLTAFDRAGIAVLIVKGGALAYTHYETPHLRPCADVDLFVGAGDFARSRRLLESIGFSRQPSVERDVHRQRTFVAQGPVPFKVDLHWALSNRPLFAAMFSFEECLATAVRIGALGNHALTLDPPRSLLLACIHRVAHHDDSDRLIWLCDIARIAERLSAAEWDVFWRLAYERKVVLLCADALRMAVERADGRRQILDRVPDASSREESAKYLGGGASTGQNLWLDLRATPTLSGRLQLVFDHAFPDAAYMRTRFGARGGYGSLLLAYARRVLGRGRHGRADTRL